ncbi:MAG: aminodeoxychorismate synthase component I [Candidatus Kryptonium sp.]|nr:aminodeoxychorismate synthase component I [Candidatus Kryptonium sp.]MDW8109668.1 aminodeoxychorismate synthase component I [Candidatus Kryptonium sp.]
MGKIIRCGDKIKLLKIQASYLNDLESKVNFVFLETTKFDDENLRSILLVEPVEILSIKKLDEIPELFEKIEKHLASSHIVAGYFAYECGYHFDKFKLKNQYLPDYSLAWFGVYDDFILFELDHSMEAVEEPNEFESENLCYKLENLKFNLAREDYVEKISKIKNYIIAGDTYQINFTGKFKFDFDGSVIALYKSLREKQKVSYSALIKTDEISVLSFSPELFFRISGDKIITKPMKGTIKRGRTLEEDKKMIEWLKNDEKSRAENLMIVDLMRNDIGKISVIGTVKVSKLFEVEKYKTLFQMTSTIEGKLWDNLTYYDVFKAIFPSGSVTGAPKIRSMEIINELENEPRGIYTGAIGFFAPANKLSTKREAVFNVSIRTIVIKENRGEMGSGGGIVYDSDPDSEYEECLLKAKFLTEPSEKFEIIESILWDVKYNLLDKHIKRMSESAEYFDFNFDAQSLISLLKELELSFEAGKKYKVRVSLNSEGRFKLEKFTIEEDLKGDIFVAISSVRTNSSDIFLYHKTTKRELYDRMFEKAKSEGFADVIFMNEKGQITEGSISNIFIKKNGKLFTPPVECGLLNGVYRQHILETHREAEEKVLYLNDLLEADEIYICNAIRGKRRCILKPVYLAI